MSTTYDMSWLKRATFEELDAAMNDFTSRREVSQLLKTPQGEAIGKQLIESRKASSDEKYSMDWLQTATYEMLKAALVDPSARPQIEKLGRTPKGARLMSEIINGTRVQETVVEQTPATPEEQVQIDADLARANAEAAEAERIATEEAARTAQPVVEEKKKIVIDYQVDDEKGNPIGRRTHIEGWTSDEVIEKLKAAHVNAVRYAERVKKTQIVYADAQDKQKKLEDGAKQMEQEAADAVEVASKEKDPAKLQDAIKKVSKAEREAEIARKAASAQGKIIADTWMEDHKHDFQPCDASSKIIGDWLTRNGREFSYVNLEAAFEATKHQLPAPTQQVVEEVSAAQVDNPPVVASVAPAASAASITSPAAAASETVLAANAQPVIAPVVVPTAPSSASAAATNTPAARRPGVNGSLPPGTLTAGRPLRTQESQTTQQVAEFKRLVAKMPGHEFRKQLTTSKEFRDKCAAAGIIDAAQRQ